MIELIHDRILYHLIMIGYTSLPTESCKIDKLKSEQTEGLQLVSVIFQLYTYYVSLSKALENAQVQNN